MTKPSSSVRETSQWGSTPAYTDLKRSSLGASLLLLTPVLLQAVVAVVAAAAALAAVSSRQEYGRAVRVAGNVIVCAV